MKKNPWMMLLVLLFVFGTLLAFLVGASAISLFGGRDHHIRMTSKDSILHIKLEGVIMDGERFLKNLKKYRIEKDIKAIVIDINSPGGVVGPSQEIYEEIKRTREEFKIPVVAFSNGLMASGAYYSAVAADKIIAAPGAMLGSIGVIMEFANLEKLYDWAKVSRYTITTGKYKDSGAEYRSMREDERALFQDMINEVWEQFKQAVATGRNMKYENVQPYADGRVFTGATAVKLGFADEVGTLHHAFEVAADLAKLEDYEIFEVPKRRPSVWDFLQQGDDEEATSRVAEQLTNQFANKLADGIFNQFLKANLVNKPLYLMPGYWQ